MIRYLQVPHPVLTFGALLRCFGYGFIVELIVAMMRPRKQGPTERIEGWGNVSRGVGLAVAQCICELAQLRLWLGGGPGGPGPMSPAYLSRNAGNGGYTGPRYFYHRR
jgi:hypothetical protein